MRACVLLVAVLMTPLGAFVCERVTCEGTPDPDYRGYWKPPVLLVTVANRPFGVLECRPVVTYDAPITTWAC